MENQAYTRLFFQDYSGYLLTRGNARHELLAVRHSASESPWTDQDIHLHEASEEFFLLVQGELIFLIKDRLFNLYPEEILMIKPNVPHAIVRGAGLIEHFGFRAQDLDDRQSLGPLGHEFPYLVDSGPREINTEWGYRVPLAKSRNRNCWVMGYGQARFPSSHVVFAFLDFPSHKEANAGIGTRHRVHIHRESWEYYALLKGSMTLLIDGQEVPIHSGEMLEVHPGAWHTLLSRQAPYVGFTFRVPVLDDKVEF